MRGYFYYKAVVGGGGSDIFSDEGLERVLDVFEGGVMFSSPLQKLRILIQICNLFNATNEVRVKFSVSGHRLS